MGKEVKNVEESYKKVKFADGWAFVNSYGERINKKGYYFIYVFMKELPLFMMEKSLVQLVLMEMKSFHVNMIL